MQKNIQRNIVQKQVSEIDAEIEELKKKIRHLKKEKVKILKNLHPGKTDFLEYNKDNSIGENNV
jgi:archaellum component FlaC